MTDKCRNVAILIFDEVEVLDFCGPFEVFSVTGGRAGIDPFNVYTVSEKGETVSARGGLQVIPKFSIDTAPRPDIVLVPGGYGTRREMHNERLIAWIRECAQAAELVLSVCTGALMLARAGLLEGLEATTHWAAIDLLRETAPGTSVRENVRFVDNGDIVTSAGVAAGIDMALHVVGRLMGAELATEAARYMEYDWRPQPA